MNTRIVVQLLSILLIYAAAFFLINPAEIAMPENMHMLMLLGVVVVAVSFATLVLAEGPGDERETAHRAIAGRVAFFVGALMMVGGVVYQTFMGMLDPWLLLSLCAMLTGKVIARVVSSYTQ